MSHIIVALIAFAAGCYVAWHYKDAIIENLREIW